MFLIFALSLDNMSFITHPLLLFLQRYESEIVRQNLSMILLQYDTNTLRFVKTIMG